MATTTVAAAGDTFESFLIEQGIRDEVYRGALKGALAWLLANALGKRLKIELLDPPN